MKNAYIKQYAVLKDGNQYSVTGIKHITPKTSGICTAHSMNVINKNGIQTALEPSLCKTRTALELCGLRSSQFLVSLLTATKNPHFLNVSKSYTPAECHCFRISFYAA